MLSQKMDQVNEKICNTERDRDDFLQECQLAEAKLYDFTTQAEGDDQRRNMLEKDCALLSNQVNDLLTKNESFLGMEERNANL